MNHANAVEGVVKKFAVLGTTAATYERVAKIQEK